MLQRDAVWAQDATLLGRDERGGAVHAEVVREPASTRTIGLSVGPPSCCHDVIALLEPRASAAATRSCG